MKQIEIPNSKDEKIAAVIHYPKEDTDELAILCPGFLDSKDYDHLVTLSKDLASRGYTVVRFDPIGTWESEGDISEYHMTQYLDDIQTVLEYMLNQKDFKHTLLGGHSRGGQMSILYAARDPRISKVLAIMPSHGPVDGAPREEWEQAGVKTSQRDLPDDRYKTTEFNVPFSHVTDRDKYDAVADIKKVHEPVILVAGELDDLVPPEEVQELYDSANEPKQFLILEGIDHDYRLDHGKVRRVNDEILKALGTI